jgi:p-hydroxybenzoate 3-monooxygenase
VVKDLIAARLDAGGALEFEAEVAEVDTEHGVIRRAGGGELRCAVVAGCDGFHGVSRAAVPESALSVYERVYPFAWLGILARAAPSSEELIYTHHARGFALHSMRTPEVTRLYLQVPPEEDVEAWDDARIWEELQTRMALADGSFALNEGEIFEKGIAPMRSFVAEPMRHGRLFLAGDAAHIVPATGAKGLNLAVADVRVLARGLRAFFEHGDARGLDGYSERCLRRVWRVQHFSWWMTQMLHRLTGDPFEAKLQRSQLDYVVRSQAAATTLAENYVGLELEDV